MVHLSKHFMTLSLLVVPALAAPILLVHADEVGLELRAQPDPANYKLGFEFIPANPKSSAEDSARARVHSRRVVRTTKIDLEKGRTSTGGTFAKWGADHEEQLRIEKEIKKTKNEPHIKLTEDTLGEGKTPVYMQNYEYSQRWITLSSDGSDSEDGLESIPGTSSFPVKLSMDPGSSRKAAKPFDPIGEFRKDGMSGK